MCPITVSVFASHPLAESCYKQLLAGFSDFRVASNAETPLVGIFDFDASRVHAELILKRRTFPKLRPVLLLSNCTDDRALYWLRSGVWGVVSHCHYQEDLPKAVRLIASGQFWFQASVLSRQIHFVPVAAVRPAVLTAREDEVMNLLLQGFSNKEISAQLRIAERTVKFHVSSILQKTKVSSRHELLEQQNKSMAA